MIFFRSITLEALSTLWELIKSLISSILILINNLVISILNFIIWNLLIYIPGINNYIYEWADTDFENRQKEEAPRGFGNPPSNQFGNPTMPTKTKPLPEMKLNELSKVDLGASRNVNTIPKITKQQLEQTKRQQNIINNQHQLNRVFKNSSIAG